MTLLALLIPLAFLVSLLGTVYWIGKEERKHDHDITDLFTPHK